MVIASARRGEAPLLGDGARRELYLYILRQRQRHGASADEDGRECEEEAVESHDGDVGQRCRDGGDGKGTKGKGLSYGTGERR